MLEFAGTKGSKLNIHVAAPQSSHTLQKCSQSHTWEEWLEQISLVTSQKCFFRLLTAL